MGDELSSVQNLVLNSSGTEFNTEVALGEVSLLLADSRESNEDDQDNSSNDSESFQGESARGAVNNTVGRGIIGGVHGDGGDSSGGEFKDGVELG